ncbi:hypothetical protein ACHAXA_003860 [Cyclostephanos tholiformis]|uniref:Tetratricopeptide SHNi-TPR domain-containing protein n=1 Tax=Cyclostephanos tholiformis TaxID=382380 RepID=A0ABD3RWW5_9STRA
MAAAVPPTSSDAPRETTSASSSSSVAIVAVPSGGAKQDTEDAVAMISPECVTAAAGMTTTTTTTMTMSTPSPSSTIAPAAAASAFAASLVSSPSGPTPPAPAPSTTAVAAVADPTATTSKTTPATYFTSKMSVAYQASNRLLKAGMLDDALSTLEGEMRRARGRGGGDELDELHESLAPLYYLYGTTLLYSVEESDDMMADDGGGGKVRGEEGEMNGAAAATTTTTTPGDGEDDDDDDDDDDEDEVEDERGCGVGEVADDDGTVRAVADPAMDLEVAWENLDLARAIVTRLVDDLDVDDGGEVVAPVKSDEHDDAAATADITPGDRREELLLDLAQIHLRLGDLQRQNDNVRSCIDDYERSLSLRTRVVGRYDRKVANCHFSLAQVYAEAPNKILEGEGRVDAFVTGLVGPEGEGGVGVGVGGGYEGGESRLTEERKAEYRIRSSEHYLACGTSFAGMLAKMCGIVDADGFVSNVDDVAETSASAFASSASAYSASSSPSASSSIATDRAKAMSRLRQRTLTLVLPPTSSSSTRAEFDDIREIMDEIQEAMDSAEETESGLRCLGEMKANELKKREVKSGTTLDNSGSGGEGGGMGDDAIVGGAVTTIGFGNPSPYSDTFGVGSGANVSFTDPAPASAAGQPTMMIVKKKKKPSEQVRGEDPPKRLKTN